MKVLVTGSAGSVGRPVCRELARRGHEVRGLDRVPTPDVPDAIVGDIADPEPVHAAMRGVQAVVHLAAEPNDTEFSRLVGPNVVGLYNVMNAAREERVRRAVLASSVQVHWNRPPGSLPARVDEASPGNHYALTKLWAEDLGAMYARRFEMSVIAVRLSWLVRNPDEARRFVAIDRKELFFSHRDAGRFFALAVETPGIDYAVVYASSIDGAKAYDLEPARRLLGYEPEDRWPDGLDFELPPELRRPPDAP